MVLLKIENLTTHYLMDNGAAIKAVDNISFHLEKGQSLGLAGESGCGKSTAALSILRLIKGPKFMQGRVLLNGQSILDLPEKELNRVRWEKISLVSQAAMNALNPVFRVGDQICEAIRAHRKLKKKQTWQIVEQLLNQVDIDPDRARSFPNELSGGMRQRAVIAMALALDPEIIIADEPTTALDVVTQAQIIKIFRRLQKERGIAVIFISHDLSILGQACDRILIMYAGSIVEMSDTQNMFNRPYHPYTRSLLDCFPDIRGKKKIMSILPVNPPDLLHPPAGCRFHPRCPQAGALCRERKPDLRETEPGRFLACHMELMS